MILLFHVKHRLITVILFSRRLSAEKKNCSRRRRRRRRGGRESDIPQAARRGASGAPPKRRPRAVHSDANRRRRRQRGVPQASEPREGCQRRAQRAADRRAKRVDTTGRVSQRAGGSWRAEARAHAQATGASGACVRDACARHRSAWERLAASGGSERHASATPERRARRTAFDRISIKVQLRI